MLAPFRGEIWLVDLDPTRGHEQAGKRPGLVVSVDLFNHGPAGLVVLLLLITRAKGIPFHMALSFVTGFAHLPFTSYFIFYTSSL